MPLSGRAALAMWWDMDPAMRAEFEDWHSTEHFPERLALPGFLRASRWADASGGEGFFVLYEIVDVAALTSPQYLARLNAPTPWSRRLMPHHRNMVRSPSMVVRSVGNGEGKHAVTIRLAQGTAEELAALVDALAARPAVGGAHLLQAQRQAIAATTEHRIRGSADQVADWIVLVHGEDAGALAAAAGQATAAAAVREHAVVGRYILRLALRA